MANFEDFPPIICLTANFLPTGGGANSCEILTSASIYYRWGDYPEKLNLDYIASLIETGGWFDGKHPFIRVDRRKTPAQVYAPTYFLDNEDRFEYLLVPPTDRI